MNQTNANDAWADQDKAARTRARAEDRALSAIRREKSRIQDKIDNSVVGLEELLGILHALEKV